jgi:hypothetical protein
MARLLGIVRSTILARRAGGTRKDICHKSKGNDDADNIPRVRDHEDPDREQRGSDEKGAVMPAGLNRIRETMNVEPTARDKGLTLILKLTAYDNGMLELDGVPLNDHKKDDQVAGWLAAAEVLASTLNEFHRQVAARSNI